MNRILFLLAACVASPALATGDHDWTDRATFVCGNSATLVLILDRNTTNGGMGPGRDERTWATVDVATGAVKRSAPPLVAPPGCGLPPSAPPRVPYSLDVPDVGYLGFVLAKDTLVLKVGGPAGQPPISRTVPLAWVTSTTDHPHDEGKDAEQPVAEVPAGSRTVFVFSQELYFYTPVVFAAVDTEALKAARASMFNDVGLQLHRQGKWKHALAWFGESSLDIARYNSACAYARLKDPSNAVRELRAVRDAKKLAAKIAKDRDFDDIRSDRELTELIRSLGGRDGGP